MENSTFIAKSKLLNPNLKFQFALFFISISFFLNFSNYLFFIPFPIMLYLFIINIKTIEIDFDFICIVFLSFFNAGYSILFLINIGLPASLMYLFVLAIIIYTIAGCLVTKNIFKNISEKAFFELFLLTTFLTSLFWYLVLLYQNPTQIYGLTLLGKNINILGHQVWGVNLFWVCSTPFIYLVPFYIKKYNASKKTGISLFFLAFIMSILINSKFMMLFVIICFFIIYPLYSLFLFIPIVLICIFGHDTITKTLMLSYDRIINLPNNGRFLIWSVFLQNNDKIGLISSESLVKILHNSNLNGEIHTSFHCFTMNMAASVGYLGAFLSFIYISIFLYIAGKAELFYLGCLYIVALATCVAGEDPHLIAVMIIFFYGIIKCHKVKKQSTVSNTTAKITS